jgi:hypothetical protein
LSFQTSGLQLYTVQTCPDLSQPWTTLPSPVPGDGTLKSFTVPGAASAPSGFFRLLVQKPSSLSLPQGDAFAILGHSCGGIKEQVYVTGFDPATGNPTGQAYLSTTCSTGGRGSIPHTYTAWAAVTWDLTGNVVAYSALTNPAPFSAAFVATDAFGDTIYNAGAAAYLVVPIPAAPTGVSAVQTNDQFQVAWTPSGVSPAAISSSILTATPVNSSVPVLTSIVSGPATGGVIPTLQPATTYQLSVVNTTLAGSSPASSPLELTTVPASIPPSAPTGVTASWANPAPTGTNDTLIAVWQAAVPGNSPVDQYAVRIVNADSGTTLSQAVAGTTLTAMFMVDVTPNWTLTVQAHNAAGWSPWSAPFTLGGL